MQLHQLKKQSPNKSRKIIGRGGKRGTTSGRGTKGQKARSGHRIRPELRDIIKKLPKRRGHSAPLVTLAAAVVNLYDLERQFDAGAEISPVTLVAKGLISRGPARVKILGSGRVSKKFVVSGCQLSVSARSAIEAAGGQIK
ncbi:MAG: 50S ribosomal protein L15 [Patescibacteria group bacterium]